jgi:DNA end-binding protein Ku
MLFADEIVPPDRLDEIREASEVKTTKRELEMAKQLVDSLAGDFEPQKYSDTYRQEVLDLIERKAQGEEISVQAPPEEAAEPAPDLMSALKASLEAVRAREGEPVPATGNGKPAAKRTGAKKAAAKKSAARKASAKKPSRTPAKR